MIGLILQARVRSKRLFGKILFPLLNTSVLEFQVNRIKKSKTVDKLIIATSKSRLDNIIFCISKKLKIPFYRGSEKNVLQRYYYAAKKFKLKTIIRCQSDCPLIDYRVIDKVVKFYNINKKKYDYVSNILEPSYPIGMHVEIFSMHALETAFKRAKDPLELEHVTPYIYRRPNIFKIKNIEYINKNYSNLRLTLDYLEDYKLIKIISEKLYKKNKNFSLEDILNFIKKNKHLTKINGFFKKKSTV